MRIFKLLLVLLLLISAKAQAQGQILTTANSQDAILVAFANEAITIAGTSIGFTVATINPTCTDCIPLSRAAQMADCVTESAAAFFRVSVTATVPTAAVGSLIAAGSTFRVYGYANIAAFRAIRTASTSVAVYCTYYRTP